MAETNCNLNDGRIEYRELRRFVIWLIATSIPITSVVIIVGVLSHSLTLAALIVDYGLTLGLNLLTLLTLRLVLRQNSFKYPYGTGKLENFASFIYGLCILPLALSVLYAAVQRLISPPAAIDLGPALIFGFAVVRLAAFAVWITRLARRFPHHSPMLQAFYIDYRAALLNESMVFIGLVAGYFFERLNRPEVAVIIDIVIAVGVCLYLLYCGVCLMVANVQALIDLPLSEADQLKIVSALAAEFKAYSGLGVIYTQMSGSTRLVQIELSFDQGTTIEEIDEVRARIEARLRKEFGKMIFHLIPGLTRSGLKVIDDGEGSNRLGEKGRDFKK